MILLCFTFRRRTWNGRLLTIGVYGETLDLVCFTASSWLASHFEDLLAYWISVGLLILSHFACILTIK